MRSLIDIALSAEAQKAASSEQFTVGVLNAKDDEPAEIAIYGEIGNPWEQADARSVSQFLRDNKSRNVRVRINSMGGLAYDGITIHNALVAHDGDVTTIIEGMAGSAASIIAMAGNPVQMYENAHLFIHRALLIAIGNVDMMDEAKAWLTKVDDAIARTYKAKTGKALDKIHELMRGKLDGTTFTAREAVDMKFADEILSLKTGKTKNEGPVKPENCTCEYPNIVLRNGSGHDQTCRCHSEWQQRGGFRAEGEQRLRSIESMRAERIRSRRDLFVPAE